MKLVKNKYNKGNKTKQDISIFYRTQHPSLKQFNSNEK